MSCLLICSPHRAKATEMRDQVVTEMMNRRERKVRSFAPTHLPFYLTSEEGGRNSIRGSLMSTVEKPGERNITCHKNVLLFRESNHQKHLSSASVVMLHVLAEFMALRRTIFWTWIPIGKNFVSIGSRLCQPIPWKHLRGQTVHAFIGLPLKYPCENYGRLILINKTARERWGEQVTVLSKGCSSILLGIIINFFYVVVVVVVVFKKSRSN